MSEIVLFMLALILAPIAAAVVIVTFGAILVAMDRKSKDE